jgi:hypothetical protein
MSMFLVLSRVSLVNKKSYHKIFLLHQFLCIFVSPYFICPPQVPPGIFSGTLALGAVVPEDGASGDGIKDKREDMCGKALCNAVTEQ